MEYSNPYQIGLIGFNGTPEDFLTRRAISLKSPKNTIFF